MLLQFLNNVEMKVRAELTIEMETNFNVAENTLCKKPLSVSVKNIKENYYNIDCKTLLF